VGVNLSPSLPPQGHAPSEKDARRTNPDRHAQKAVLAGEKKMGEQSARERRGFLLQKKGGAGIGKMVRVAFP